MILVLGLACGGMAAWPFVRLARREVVTGRVRRLATGRRREVTVLPLRLGRRLLRSSVAATTLRVIGAPRERRRGRLRDSAMRRELPVVLDLVGVAVAAGCTPYLAVEHAAQYGPSRTAPALREVIRACSLGRSLDEALHELGASVSALRPLANVLRTTSRLGSPAEPSLARLAAEVRADVRRRAEARARTVPVRLCFPLVACILPAFALLTVAPVVLGGLRG